jgi:cellulose synthase (UDP-forming)
MARVEKLLKIIPRLIVIIPIPFVIIYFPIRFAAFYAEGYSIIDRFFSILLLAAEIFFVMHTITYLMNFLRSTELYPSSVERYFKEFSEKRVAVFIASFNEPAEVLEKTLASATVCARDIGKVYLLDDSTDESKRRDAETLAIKYGARYIHRTDRKGFKAGAINNTLKLIDEEYLAILDSDQRPLPEFLTETVSILESDPHLAFVQVPQIYTNTDVSRLALGAHCVQLVFFEYICEGKSVTNAMFSCGSNTVFRTSALREVGGFDEKSVTEDMATSITIHEHGWASKYYNKPLVAGEGPATLGAYFTQQGRWSLGSLGLCFRVIKDFIKNPGCMKPMQWWDYINCCN